MATQLQLRKGTKIQNDAFTGAEAELTYDTTTKGLRIHDGETQGGIYVGTVNHCSFNTNTRVQITTSDQTAAKNGWLVGYMSISGNNLYVSVYINDNEVVHSPWTTTSAWTACSICIPIKAGQTYRYSGTATVEHNEMYFYPDD